jgi:DNA modification methylase
MIDLRLGDCLEVLPTIPDASVDVIVTDPPYPEIDREYGRMSESTWHAMMRSVVAESRRILKPSGSAVFILQPNSEKVGRMRPWLWEFMAWTAREWNQIQDAWWWNHIMIPNGATSVSKLMRSSVKACVWLGASDCYRDQSRVLLEPSDETKKRRCSIRSMAYQGKSPSGNEAKNSTLLGASLRRGGVTPFNMIQCRGTTAKASREGNRHPAMTPEPVMDWWARYLCPPDGTLCDPFMGSGTAGIVAVKRGLNFIGIEKMARYHDIAKKRIQADLDKHALFAM